MAGAALYDLSYHRAANSLGQPVPLIRRRAITPPRFGPPQYVAARLSPTRKTAPIDRGVDFRGHPWGAARGRYGLASLGQPGATITLPDGVDHIVQAVNTSGEILTTDGWQSATQADGAERWINVHSGDVMLADGLVVKVAGSEGVIATVSGWHWRWIAAGGGALAVLLYLAKQGAAIERRRLGSAGRGALRGYRVGYRR